MTTLTNPCSLTRFQTNLHMMINIKSLGQNCRPLSCEMSLVARSEERLRHTLNYLQRLYFNKIFEKNGKIMVQELILLQKGKRSFQWCKGRKVPQLGKKLYSLKTEQFLQYIKPLLLGMPETSTRKHAPPCEDPTTKRKYLATNALNKICFSTEFWSKFPLKVWKKKIEIEQKKAYHLDGNS